MSNVMIFESTKTNNDALLVGDEMDKCNECQDEYESHEMRHGLCEDCLADFQENDLEYQLEKAMHYGELRAESKPYTTTSNEE